MSQFINLRNSVQQKLATMFKKEKDNKGILVLKKSDRDELWQVYLNAIPAEHNQIFRQRPYYDGNYDKNFIRKLGGLIFINNDLTIESIWDVALDENNFFQNVVDSLSEYVKNLDTRDYFLTNEKVAGHLANIDNYDENIVWEHFYAEIPSKYISRSLGEEQGKLQENMYLLKRSLTELTIESGEIVLDLINSNSLYRGAEFKPTVDGFVKLKAEFDSVNPDLQSNWLWVKAKELGMKCRIKNSVIGTLLTDISNDEDLESSVKSFESKVAPTNYKRTTALVTPKMIENAKKEVEDLGYEASLYRRLAVENDIPISERLFTATRYEPTEAFDILLDESKRKHNVKKMDKIESISYQNFIENVLPTAKTIEILKHHSLKSNEMVMTASVNATSPTMFKWDNDIAWTYLSDTTDAIKERVKQAGGDIEGDVRVSLSWHSPCDLDLHCHAGSEHLFFGNKKGAGGFLDLDMNGLDKHDKNNPVENIIFKNRKNMNTGVYHFVVNNYTTRSPKHDYFDIQVEILGEIKTYRYNAHVPSEKTIDCFELKVDKDKNVTIKKVGKELTLLNETSGNEFLPVKFITKSPNYWNDNKTGNEHILFVLDEFKVYQNIIDDGVRGFFNEYLKNELQPHRKVFELLGNKMRCKINPDEKIMGGYGFSVTAKSELIVRIIGSGSMQRMFKIQF